MFVNKYNPYIRESTTDILWMLTAVQLLIYEIIQRLEYIEKCSDDYEGNCYAIKLRRALENVRFSEKLMNEALDLKEVH